MIYPPLRPRSEAVLHTDERIAVRHEFHTCRPGGARGTALHEEVDPRSPWTRTRSLDSPQPAKLDVQIGCMPMLGIMNGWCYLVRILPSHPSKKIKVGLKVYYHVHQLPDVMLCQSAGERWISKFIKQDFVILAGTASWYSFQFSLSGLLPDYDN